MLRLRTNRHKTRYMPHRCICGQEPSFEHCLLQCPTLVDHFRPLHDLLRQRSSTPELRHIISWDETRGWEPLTLAATLLYSSPVGTIL